MRKLRRIVGMCFVLYCACCLKGQGSEGYSAVKQNLQQGWQASNTSNILSFTLHPQLLELSFEIKYQQRYHHGHIQGEKDFFGFTEPHHRKFRPLAHSANNDYVHLQLDWRGISLSIEMAQDDTDFYVLLSSHHQPPHPTVIASKFGFLYNKPGFVEKKGDQMNIVLGQEHFSLYNVSTDIKDYGIQIPSPHFIHSVGEKGTYSAITNKPNLSAEQVKQKVEQKRNIFNAYVATYKTDSVVYRAVSSIMGWNTIYDHSQQRIFSTVSRDWNVRRGGYAMFCWDNFFMGYMAALNNKELAFANVIEMLNEVTANGFVPNNAQGDGSFTMDRSQPPVGSMMVKEIYKKHPEKWFLEEVFERLYTWNEWWYNNRLYDGLLCWGSTPYGNPFNDIVYHSRIAASFESGLDDTPMYLDVAFDDKKNVLLLQDVGLNSLYIGDCKALAEIALVLGKNQEAAALQSRANQLSKQMERLWNEKSGMYQNRDVKKNTFSEVLTPTLFYPLIAGVPSQSRAERMMETMLDTTLFWGDWILPSVAKNDPNYPRQRYWNGAIWAPLNFLVYLGLRNYDLPEVQSQFAEKSRQLFVKGWEDNYYVGENYCAFDGTVTHPAVKSVSFYTWGGLLGMISLMENGFMPDPSVSIVQE